MVSGSMVKLISMENEAVETSLKCALMCQTIKQMFDNLGDDGELTEIPVVTVPTKTLKKIVEWLEKWQDAEQPTLEEVKDKIQETIDPWDEEYLKMELEDIYALISASNFLDIPGLLWLSTRSIAYIIKGKTAEEVREFFNIQEEWDPEELEAVKQENEWCVETSEQAGKDEKVKFF